MKTFQCTCGARVFFVNNRCMTCQRELSFLPDRGVLAAVEARDDGLIEQVGRAGDGYRRCGNQLDWGVCNWLIPSEEAETHSLCQACRLNDVIPNLDVPGHRELWANVEQAKRHLVYTLNQLRLPVRSKAEVDWGMAFRLMQDGPGREVITGHADGWITLNLEEADAAKREQVRLSLREGYRTVLGHLRHEVGHYYWDLCVRDSHHLADFRALFGDERVSYADALDRHYADGPPSNWQEQYISPYATMHPWEDWAESFAHSLHMADTLETAGHFGLRRDDGNPLGAARWDASTALTEWAEVTVALNALNRSMGMPDAYPFSLTPPIAEKLTFVAEVVRSFPSAPRPDKNPEGRTAARKPSTAPE